MAILIEIFQLSIIGLMAALFASYIAQFIGNGVLLLANALVRFISKQRTANK